MNIVLFESVFQCFAESLWELSEKWNVELDESLRSCVDFVFSYGNLFLVHDFIDAFAGRRDSDSAYH